MNITISAVTGVPDIVAGDDVGLLLVDAIGDNGLVDGDVLVVTQKVVSKAEGRVLPAADKESAVLAEASRVLRVLPSGMAITETTHGFVCANSGIDSSNVEGAHIALLPVDPDASARRIRARVKHLTGVDVGVIVSDTFGRAWRLGQTDVAIGVAGIDPFVDHVGERDVYGMELLATRIAIADELAGAAEMVMGKAARICAAVVRGAPVRRAPGSAAQIVRPPAEDLFR